MEIRQTSTMAAVVVNNLGEILPYTVESTKAKCEEEAEALFGKETWERLKSKGAKVAQCLVILVEK